VRAALTGAGFESAVVQSLGGTRELSIRLPLEAQEETVAAAAEAADATGTAEQVDEAKAAAADDAKSPDKLAGAVLAALTAQRADVTVKRQSFVGPQVGEELKSDGIIAAVFVMLGIMIYIGIRFEKRFAIAAIASEFHDAILTVGFFALTQIDFDMTVLASLLAVIGYSINDKVVVFDRVRELFRLARKGDPEEILNRAINNTLSRTIITSLFTGITMVALYFFGGPPVHGFALTMIVGIVIGTLSSIFFANPILLWLGVSKKDLMPVTRDNPELAARP
jgi:preprotein translocase subunit SecF